jgi:hypothetical protein
MARRATGQLKWLKTHRFVRTENRRCGHYKNSFFAPLKKGDFGKITKGAWILGGTSVCE